MRIISSFKLFESYAGYFEKFKQSDAFQKIKSSNNFRYIIGSMSVSGPPEGDQEIFEVFENLILHNFTDKTFKLNYLSGEDDSNYQEAIYEDIVIPFFSNFDEFFKNYIDYVKPYPESRELYLGIRKDFNSEEFIDNHFRTSKIISDKVKDIYNLYRWEYAGKKIDPEHYEYLGQFANQTVRRK